MQASQVFDRYSARYDSDFTETAIGRLQRNQVRHHLLGFLTAPAQILEINCGTGEDALWLADLGHEVIATDISGGMIEVCEQKDRKKGKSRVRFQRMDFLDVRDHFAADSFDLVLSNFGGLNCINADETIQLATGLAHVLKPGGLVVAVYMSTDCLWEKLLFLAKMQPAKMNRRRRSATEMKINGQNLKVFFYRPRQVSQLFSKYFSTDLLKPIGLFLPPPYLKRHFDHKDGLLQSLQKLDSVFNRSWFANFADHFMLIFRKLS